MSGSGLCLLVVQKGDHSLGYYDLGTGAELGRVPLDRYPHEFCLSPDQRYAYTCHFGVALAEDGGPGGNTVSIVDVQRRTRVATLSCGDARRPHGIGLDAAGGIYVTSEAGSLLLGFDPQAGPGPVWTRPTGGLGSHFVSVTRDGSLAFCSNMVSGTVTAIASRETTEPVVIAVGERPEGSVLNEDESRLYVVNRESASISVVDTSTLMALEPISTPPGPVRICLGPGGKLLVALYHGRGLALIDPQRPDEQTYLQLPAEAIAISYDRTSGLIPLSLLGDQVCLVDERSMTLVRSIKTRADPDPTAVVPMRSV